MGRSKRLALALVLPVTCGAAALLGAGCSDDVLVGGQGGAAGSASGQGGTAGTGQGGTAGTGQGGTAGASASGSGGQGGTAGAGGTSASGGFGGDGGAAGAGGTGPPPSTGADDCPGDGYSLTAPTTLVLPGDTATASHLHTGAGCLGGPTDSNGPERVYELSFLSHGTLTVEVLQGSGSSLDPTLYLRSACPSPQSSLGCFSLFPTQEGFARDLPQPATWWLFVDGAAGTAGGYVLTVDLQPPVCGDDVVNPNGADGTPYTPDDEDCDDGTMNGSGGCSLTCKFAPVSLFDVCDGEPIVLQPNMHQYVEDSTTGYSDDYTAAAGGGCPLAPMTGGKDRVYEVIPVATGTVTASIGFDASGMIDMCVYWPTPYCWDGVLWAVGPTQCAGGPQVACSNATAPGPEVISFPVQAAQSYFIIVDGYAQWQGNYGPYYLHLDLL